MQKIALLLVMTLSSKILAGNISSGGGEFIGDEQNPWFLEPIAGEPATGAVKYCVDVGSDFVVSKTRLQELALSTITWWDTQVSSAHIPINEFYTGAPNALKIRVKLQTTRYIEVQNCDQDVDLRFQFGILTESQIRDLKAEGIDPTKFVGIAIRTDYNRKMRGKGYIYISPDRGDLAMRSPNILPNIWEKDDDHRFNNNPILAAILKHEFGHVLGIPHTLSGVMDAKTPERLTTSIYDRPTYDLLDKPVFFPGSTTVESCDPIKHAKLFSLLQADKSAGCVGLYIDINQIRVYTKISWGSDPIVSVQKTLTDGYLRRFHDLISVSLPVDRDVYTAVPPFYRTLKGPGVTEILQEISVSINSKDVSLFIQKDPHRFQIGGVVDGRIVPDAYAEGSQWVP
jgi:hypothetical protein